LTDQGNTNIWGNGWGGKKEEKHQKKKRTGIIRNQRRGSEGSKEEKEADLSPGPRKNRTEGGRNTETGSLERQFIGWRNRELGVETREWKGRKTFVQAQTKRKPLGREERKRQVGGGNKMKEGNPLGGDVKGSEKEPDFDGGIGYRSRESSSFLKPTGGQRKILGGGAGKQGA